MRRFSVYHCTSNYAFLPEVLGRPEVERLVVVWAGFWEGLRWGYRPYECADILTALFTFPHRAVGELVSDRRILCTGLVVEMIQI